MQLPPEFFRRNDVLTVSRDLLGKVLVARVGGLSASVVITETEAYAGIHDRASHAYGGRRTRRTEPMYCAGGTAYVFLCYGIHHLFNVVVGDTGNPLAILVRAGMVHGGTTTILQRRGKKRLEPGLLVGPGKLAQGLGITTELTGTSLLEGPIRVEDQGIAVPETHIISSPRVGIDYAGEDAALPYRFRVSDSSLALPRRIHG